MKDPHEIIDYNPKMPMKLFYQRIGHSPRHWHRSLEILFVLSGEMDILIENKNYHLIEDDIILINPNQLHETHSRDCVLIAFQLRLSMFQLDWLTPETIAFDCNSSTHPDKQIFHPLKVLLAKLVQINSVPEKLNELVNFSYAYQLIHELTLNFRSETMPVSIRSQKNLDRLRSILTFIEEHYTDDLSLKSLSDLEFLTPTYLSHFFQDNMGMPLTSYITRFRLDKSMQDLLYTDLSLDEVALRNGFPNARSYSKYFMKEYKKLPSQYRKENAGPYAALSPLDTPKSINYLTLDKFDFFDKLAVYLKDTPSRDTNADSNGVIQSLGNISMSEITVTLKHTFKCFCSVGRAKELLYESIRDMLRTLQREIGFQYIKFHGIFDDELGVFRLNDNGEPVINYFYLDQVFDFILSLGLKPLVQLSFMPRALAKNPNRTLFHYPFIISEPNNEEHWVTLISSLTKHFITRYGTSEVYSWIFTFWNETMNCLPFDFQNVDTFLHLYEITYHAVKEVDPGLVFSSTSYENLHISSDHYIQFLQYAKANHCEPDAYLFHFYPTAFADNKHLARMSLEEFNRRHTDGRLLLDTNPEAFDQCLEEIRQVLSEEKGKPVYITEWNLTPSHREWLNDTCFSSAYILRNILVNYDKVDSFCHWSLTDWLEELPFSEELFHGGMGFFTRNGIKKPTYYAYYFLSKLEQHLVTRGDGFFVTRGAHRYVILLYHYVHFSDLYAQGIMFHTTFTQRYHTFDYAVNKTIHFTLSDIENGSYLITERIVNRHSGSVFDKWLEMGAVELKTQEEVDSLRQLSQPMLYKKLLQTSNHCLPYSATLEPLEIRLVEIELIQ